MNEIVKSNPSIIVTMDDAERAAKAMSASGFFQDAKQAAQAVVKILAGQELGFGPFASMTGVHIIQNKPTLAANLIAAAVKRTGKYNYQFTQHTDLVCELAFYENGKEVGKSRFTMEDAKKAGVTSNPSWSKYPRNMLFARAISNGQKWFAPDIFNGTTVYTPEELGAEVDEDGNAVINGKVSQPLLSETDKQASHEHENQDTGTPEDAIELIDPHGDFAVNTAMKEWNADKAQAIKEIWKLFPKGTNRMTEKEIRDAIKEGVQA
jgi:hypothetical protein